MDEATPKVYTLYRAVARNPASDYDLMSNAERGTEPLYPLVGRQVEAWTGVSCWSRFDAARDIAQRNGYGWLAEIHLVNPPVRVVHLVGKPYHLTVFASVTTLRAAIVRYHPIT